MISSRPLPVAMSNDFLSTVAMLPVAMFDDSSRPLPVAMSNVFLLTVAMLPVAMCDDFLSIVACCYE